MELKPRDRIVQLRVVYYGPGVCGKTTNLQMLHAAALGRHRGELITVNSKQERTILFDLLPLRGIGFHGFDIRFQLVGVPGQAPYGATRRLVMRGTDAVVFVANSAADRLDDNLGSLAEMNDNLRANALDPATIPIVFQYNKRDLPQVSSVEELNLALNARQEPVLEAVGLRGEGVIETHGTLNHKKKILSEWLDRVKPGSICDLGANNGVFTRLASDIGIPSIAFDIDPAAVEQNYRHVKSAGEQFILPLLQDLTNPSPALGWQSSERDSFLERVHVDMVFALALIHHLAISNNVILTHLVEFFSGLSNWLVIEFVPKSDSQVQKLLASRLDIFDQYTLEDFEQVFGSWFIIHEKVHICESERYLYLMENRTHSK